jgi:hypothetical protein
MKRYRRKSLVETTKVKSAKETKPKEEPIDRKPTITIIIQFRFEVSLTHSMIPVERPVATMGVRMDPKVLFTA